MDYQTTLRRKFFDFPPSNNNFEKYGFYFDEVDPKTVELLRRTNIQSAQDELKFYQELEGLPGAAMLFGSICGRMFCPYVPGDFEARIHLLESRTEYQYHEDAHTYFQYHGLDLTILFQYLQSRIDNWFAQNQVSEDMQHLAVYEPDPENFEYDLGFIPDFDGVQMCDDCSTLPLPFPPRQRGGDDDGGFPPSPPVPPSGEVEEMDCQTEGIVAYEEIMPSSPSYSPGASCSNSEPRVFFPHYGTADHDDLTPIDEIPAECGVVEFITTIKTDINFQKIYSEYAIDTEAYAYGCRVTTLRRFGHTLPDSCIEKYVLGGLLIQERLDEQVPPALVKVFPSLEGLTVQRGIDEIAERASKYIKRQIRRRKLARLKTGKIQVMSAPKRVAFVPAGESSERETEDEL